MPLGHQAQDCDTYHRLIATVAKKRLNVVAVPVIASDSDECGLEKAVVNINLSTMFGGKRRHLEYRVTLLASPETYTYC